jgi:hypothetical protein
MIFGSFLSRGALALPGNEVHLWCAALDLDPARLDCFEKMLAPDEGAQAARFHFPKD